MRKMMMALAVAALPVSVVVAQGMPDMKGGMGPFDGNTMMSLSAQATRAVTQDRLAATLQIEKVAKDAAEAQKFINTRMQAAQAVAKKVDGLKVSTGNYSVYKQYAPEPEPKDGKPWTPEEREKHAMWQASQQLILDGADKDAVLKVVAKLQKDGFAVQGLNYYLSREASEKLKDELAAEALETIKQRAESLSKVLGAKDVQYVWLDINDGGAMQPRPVMMRAMAMFKGAGAPEMDMSMPVAEAGETDVTVSVNANVKLMK